jgi:hypothetical protein
MNKKLKIYSALLAIVLVGTFISNMFHRENYSSVNREGEVLTLDSLKEEFGRVSRKTTVHVDTVDGTRDTIGTTTSYNVQLKPTLEVTVPVQPRHGATDKFLYSSVDGKPCMVEMQQVKLKVPMEEESTTFTIVIALMICLLLPPTIWLLVIILKVIHSVYKGEIFVTQIAKRLETAGWLLIAFWFLATVVSYVQIQILRDSLLIAYYDIPWQSVSIYYIIFGLVLMILSQIILKGKDLKDEQELTI